MSDMFPITLDDELVELTRELLLRRKVYPRWVANGQVTQARADRQIAVMESALNRLMALKAAGKQ